MKTLTDKNGNKYVHENLLIDLAKVRNNTKVKSFIEHLYNPTGKIKLSNRYLYTNVDGTYITLDSLDEASQAKEVDIEYIESLIVRFVTSLGFNTGMMLHLIGRTIFVKKIGTDDKWDSISNFLVSDLESGNYIFDFKENIKSKFRK